MPGQVQSSFEGESHVQAEQEAGRIPTAELEEAQIASHQQEQPGGSHPWVAIRDPTSGETYYHNTQSDETTWTRPPAHIASISQYSFEGASRFQAEEEPDRIPTDELEEAQIASHQHEEMTVLTPRVSTRTYGGTVQEISRSSNRSAVDAISCPSNLVLLYIECLWGFRVYIFPDDDLLQAQAETLQTSYPIRFETSEDQALLFDLSSNPQLARIQGGDRVQFLLDEGDSLRVHVVPNVPGWEASDPADVQVLFG